MPYPYSAGDKLPASEYNEVVKAAGIYAADAGASDAYAITPTPAPSSYVAGMVFNFKANTANTGAATLNVNGLGAKTIKKNVSADLDTGDISAGQIVTVVYDGTNFQLIGGASEKKLGTTVTRSTGVNYQAATDIFVFGAWYSSSGGMVAEVLSDSSATPTTVVQKFQSASSNQGAPFCIPVKKGDYYKVVATNVSCDVFEKPLSA
jgi:hypothetical protein